MSQSSARKKINFTKSVKTYNMLLDACEILIEEQGLMNFTIQDLAKKSGFGAGTLYLYFEEKNAILEALLRREVHTITEELHHTLLPLMPLSVEKTWEEFFKIVLKRKNKLLYAQLIAINSVADGNATGIQISDLIQKGIQAEVKRFYKEKSICADSEKKSYLLFQLLKGLLSTKLEKKEQEGFAAWLTHFTVNFLIQDTK